MSSSLLSLKVLLSGIVHTANIEIRPCVKWLLTRGEKQRKIIETSPMICGHGCLQEVAVSERFQL